jgi:hypothetical protein
MTTVNTNIVCINPSCKNVATHHDNMTCSNGECWTIVRLFATESMKNVYNDHLTTMKLFPDIYSENFIRVRDAVKSALRENIVAKNSSSSSVITDFRQQVAFLSDHVTQMQLEA